MAARARVAVSHDLDRTHRGVGHHFEDAFDSLLGGGDHDQGRDFKQLQGRLNGQVTVVPQANPLGIGQFRQGRILGRFHDATGHNFNRGFDQSAAMAQPSTNVQHWQKSLVQLAASAQVVLDLHTDDEALPYLYVHRSFWPRGRELAAARERGEPDVDAREAEFVRNAVLLQYSISAIGDWDR